MPRRRPVTRAVRARREQARPLHCWVPAAGGADHGIGGTVLCNRQKTSRDRRTEGGERRFEPSMATPVAVLRGVNWSSSLATERMRVIVARCGGPGRPGKPGEPSAQCQLGPLGDQAVCPRQGLQPACCGLPRVPRVVSDAEIPRTGAKAALATCDRGALPITDRQPGQRRPSRGAVCGGAFVKLSGCQER
jgi:hypothetical protein